MIFEKPNPFDIVSGKVVQNEHRTLWFKEPGNNINENGFPIYENLHRIGGPAEVYNDGMMCWVVNGNLHREDGPAVICPGEPDRWFLHNCRIGGVEIKQLLEKLK